MKEVFIVQGVMQVTCKLEEWDGTALEGSFYKEDVQQVTLPDNNALFQNEKILQRHGHALKVRWLGWLKKYHSWVPRSALTHV